MKSEGSLRLLRKIWTYLTGKQRTVLVTVTFLSILAGFAATAPALVVGHIVNRLLGEITSPSLTFLVAELAVLFTVFALLRAVTHIALHDVLPRIEVVFRSMQVVRSLQTPLDDDDLRYAAQINSQLSRGTDAVSSLVKLSFGQFVPALVQVAWAIALTFSQNWIVGIATLCATPIGFTIVYLQLRSQSGIRVQIAREKSRLDGALTELLQGKATVRSLNAVDAAAANIRRDAQALADAERSHHKAMGLYDVAKFLVESLFAVVVIIIGIALVRHKVMTPGGVLTLYLLFAQVAMPLREIHRMRDEANESEIQTALMFELLDMPVDPIFTRPSLPQLQEESGSAITIDHVTVRYSQRSAAAVSDASLDVAAGSFIGLCGPAGSGKTTLLKCVAGLTMPDAGAISLFGRPLASYDVKTLGDVVSYASQAPYLIAGSIRENVCFGLHREVSDQEVQDALDLAQIGEEIATMPKGIETRLGEAGLGLSGGQKQRVVLARLLLRKPRVLLLDEATSALDNLRELAIMRMLENLDITVVAIAHRLTTLRNADAIYVMKDGHLVEHGGYQQLLGAGQLFSELVAAAERAGELQSTA